MEEWFIPWHSARDSRQESTANFPTYLSVNQRGQNQRVPGIFNEGSNPAYFNSKFSKFAIYSVYKATIYYFF